MLNINQLTEQLRMMPDQALQRVAMMYKEDPYIFPMVISEGMARKKMRMAAQAQPGQQPPKVVDQAVAAIAPQPQMPPPNAGLPSLPAPNMQNMADGGIAGYADEADMDFAQHSEPVVRMAEGGVAKYQSGGQPRSSFDDAVDFVLGVEGGDYVANDAGKGPSKWGILQSANPGIDVKNLTRDQAKAIYRERYWSAINGDELAKADPKLAKIAFDTAVNMGPGTAQQMLSKSGGDPNKMLELRSNRYQEIVKSNPKQYEQYAKGWENRLNKLAAETVVPKSGPALPADELAKARAGTIPGSELNIGGKRYTYEGQEIPEARKFTPGERVVGAGETALSMLSGIPGLVVGGGKTALQAMLEGKSPTEEQFARNVGQFTYTPRGQAGQEMTAETAKFLTEDMKLPPFVPGAQAGRVPRQLRPAVATAEAEAAAQKVASPRLTQAKPDYTVSPSGVATPVASTEEAALAALAADKAAAARAAQNAARASTIPGRAAEEAAYASQVGRRASMVGAAAAAAGEATAPEFTKPKEAPKGPATNLLTPEQKDLLVETAKNTTEEKKKGWTNDDWLNFGFSLLSSRSPYFMQALGTAGLQTLAARKEREESEINSEARKALAEKYRAEAEYTKGERVKEGARRRALQFAQSQINALKSNPQSYAMTPEQLEAKYNEIYQNAYQTILKQEGIGGETSVAAASPNRLRYNLQTGQIE